MSFDYTDAILQLSVCLSSLAVRTLHIYMCLCIVYSCIIIVHAKFLFWKREKKVERRDSIEFTHKLVSSLIAVPSFRNHKILQLQHDVLRVLVNPKINITATARRHHHHLHRTWWHMKLKSIYRFRSAKYTNESTCFISAILKCILSTFAALQYDWWQKLVCYERSFSFPLHCVCQKLKAKISRMKKMYCWMQSRICALCMCV